MDFGLADKKALVLGASRGLGAACARELAIEGAEVFAAARNTDAISAWAEEEGLSDRVTPLALDLSDPESVAEVGERMAEAGIDILVNNCGGPAAGPAQGQSHEAWTKAFSAMALPIFALTDALLPGMKEREFGRVVTIGSSGLIAPIPNLALSNGVRGAILGWSKTLAAEVANAGVTVNVVLPGRIGTDRVRELDEGKAAKTGSTLEEVRAASKTTIPMGRYGEPAEFAAAVAFLASVRASYVTGSMVRVDGGMIRSL